LIDTALIVEDQAVTAFDLKFTLKGYGFSNSVIVAKGKKAIDFIESRLPSIVLLDIKLADGISGIEVAKKLKEREIPFIFISAFSDPKNLILANELKPVGIIKKPIDKKLLENMINKFKLR
jgi:CheY-like chemotaxis protein